MSLWEQSELVEFALERLDAGMYLQDYISGEHVWCPQARRVFGVGEDFVVDAESFMGLVHEADRLSLLDLVTAAHHDRTATQYHVVFRVVHGDDVRWIRTETRIDRNEAGDVLRERGIVRNITAERKMLDALAENQRRSDIERLASSIAHDFNNFLTAILCEAGLAKIGGDLPAAVRDSLARIEASAERAAVMTQQLLANTRRQVTEIRPVDLFEALGDMVGTLRNMVREDVAFSCAFEDAKHVVRTDPAQLQQVLMNLVINAVDAVGSGGSVTITVRRHDAAHHDYNELSPGNYAHITVTDDGAGIEPDALSRVFEPFFTTKSRGTGLGLPTCLSIARECGGTLTLDSEVGRGTNAHVLLPILLEDTLQEHKARRAVETPSVPTNRVVIVCEDDDRVRAATVRGCRAFGFETIEVTDADALKARLGEGQNVDLVLTDIVMPGTPIKDVRAWAATVRPELRFLFVSGYPDEANAGADMQELVRPRDAFLPKPFTPVDLAQRLREMTQD